MHQKIIELALSLIITSPIGGGVSKTPPEIGIKPIPVIKTIEPLKPIELKEIALMQPVAPPPPPRPVVSSPGNLYTPGNCTWYVKSKRPDLPNNLGNADTWTVRAAAQGYATGSTPKPGAAGQLGMHVVYVESVSGDLMVISEMNYQGLYVISGRTIPWQGWSFIY